MSNFLPADTNSLRKTPRLDRVGDGKVYDLGKAACFLQLFIRLCTEHESRSPRMNVFALLKSFEHDCVLGDMGQQPQLELRVIG